MKYAYPKLMRAGLGNKMFQWAQAVAYCHKTGAKMLAPAWAGDFAIGPWLRGERHKRFYGLQFTNKGYIKGLQRLLSILFARDVAVFQDMKGFFEPFLDDQQYVKEELWRILSQGIKTNISSIVKGGKYLAVHIRRGDFSSLGCAFPNDWYVRAIQKALTLNEVSDRKLIRVFTDGFPDEVEFVAQNFPDEVVKVMPKAPAIQDIVAMSKACALVGSPGSTFSMWAAFLGQMPSIWNKADMPTRLYCLCDKTIFVD